MDESHLADATESRGLNAELLDFYDRQVAGLYAFIARRCGDTQLAEDLTQEVFILAARQLAADGHLPPPGWLYRVARNKLVDHWRRETRRERKFRLLAGGKDEPSGPDPADAVVSAQHANRALNDLPADQRAVLVMRYLENNSVAEIAASLGRSSKAIESLLGRARKRLGKSYEAYTDA